MSMCTVKTMVYDYDNDSNDSDDNSDQERFNKRDSYGEIDGNILSEKEINFD